MIREAAFAGQFYPADTNELTQTLEELFEEAKPNNTKHPRALIVPHAGYIFSGKVAASSYNQLDKNVNYDTIFLLGSSHRLSFEGASIGISDYYQTPLGDVKVNKTIVEDLLNNHDFTHYYENAHISEHCLEVQLPFLQYHLNNSFQIVPIIVGGKNIKTPHLLAEVLKPYFTENNLFVISSDFSHYPAYEDAIKIDSETIAAICTNHPDQFIEKLDKHNDMDVPNLATDMCGWHAALTLMHITEDIKEIEYSKIDYQNSGDSIYGDKNKVVGYGAIVIEEIKAKAFELSSNAKNVLLKIARQSITTYLISGQNAPINIESLENELKTNCGAFVSLHTFSGNLRGCIGNFSKDIPLFEVVSEMAISAATKDYRFPIITPEELDDISIEISVLTPLNKINNISDIELGKHGIYISKEGLSGTFLPQVATQTNWSIEEFLGHCAQDKAGIGWDGWKDADIYTYEAIIFSE